MVLGCVEFDLFGGWINIDVLDNFVGVDCLDYEVNIKILIDLLVSVGMVKVDECIQLFELMIDEVV